MISNPSVQILAMQWPWNRSKSARLNYISQNSPPCTFPVKVAMRDLHMGDLEGRHEAVGITWLVDIVTYQWAHLGVWKSSGLLCSTFPEPSPGSCTGVSFVMDGASFSCRTLYL